MVPLDMPPPWSHTLPDLDKDNLGGDMEIIVPSHVKGVAARNPVSAWRLETGASSVSRLLFLIIPSLC